MNIYVDTQCTPLANILDDQHATHPFCLGFVYACHFRTHASHYLGILWSWHVMPVRLRYYSSCPVAHTMSMKIALAEATFGIGGIVHMLGATVIFQYCTTRQWWSETSSLRGKSTADHGTPHAQHPLSPTRVTTGRSSGMPLLVIPGKYRGYTNCRIGETRGRHRMPETLLFTIALLWLVRKKELCLPTPRCRKYSMSPWFISIPAH